MAKVIASTSQEEPSIVQFLNWPETPTRKNTRKNEKVPFVLTSSGFLKIQEQKKKEKEEKLMQKEQRRLKLLEKKRK